MEMKNLSQFSLLLVVLLFLGCGEDDDNVTVTGDGLLVRLERATNDVFYQWTDIAYDQDQNVTTIGIQLESFLQQTYEVTYNSGEPATLSLTSENMNAGNKTVVNYDIIRLGDEIILRNSTGEDKYLYRVTDGYIDYSKASYGPNNEFFNEAVFTRDADDNIETIAYFATDASSTELKVFEYTFSDHASDFDLPGVHNPIMGFDFTGFEVQLVALMGLQISNQPPLKSSYWDAGGTFRAENLSATPVIDNGFLQELSYANEGTGNDNNLVKLIYN